MCEMIYLVEQTATETSAQQQETQQIQMISASDAGTSQSISQAPTRQLQVSQQPQVPQQTQQQSQSTPPQAQQLQQQQQQQQQNLILNYEETSGGDGDSIVPSTPTLYVSRRADGFSEVSSPQPMVCVLFLWIIPNSGRAKFY